METERRLNCERRTEREQTHLLNFFFNTNGIVSIYYSGQIRVIIIAKANYGDNWA